MIEAARDSARVSQIIQSELEDLRTLSWADVEGLNNWDVFSPTSALGEAYGDRYTIYRYKYARTSNQFGLRVYVLWKDNGGHTKYDYFETWYTKGGFNDYYYRSF